jgi:hypothetical protein
VPPWPGFDVPSWNIKAFGPSGLDIPVWNIKARVSSNVSLKAKSLGKRSRLRATALLRLKVVTP